MNFYIKILFTLESSGTYPKLVQMDLVFTLEIVKLFHLGPLWVEPTETEPKENGYENER